MSADLMCLEVLNGPDKGLQYRLLGEAAVIGRAPECHICLDGIKGVSRQHAKVQVLEGHVRVMDLGSQNGIFVDGKKVREAMLSPGSKLKVGQIVMRVASVENDSALPAAAANAGIAPAGLANPAAAPGGALGPAAGEFQTSQLDGQELMMAAGQGAGKFLSTIVLIVALFGAGLYILNNINQRIVRVPAFSIVRANETKVVDFERAFDKYSTPSKSKDKGVPVITARPFDGMLMPSFLNLKSNRRAPRKDLLVIKGVTEGDGTVILKNSSGAVVRECLVLVRGVKPRLWPDDITASAARDLAQQAMDDSKILLKDNNPYAAYLKMKMAEELYDKYSTNPNKQEEIHQNARELRQKISKELNRTFGEAMLMAYPDYASKRVPDYQGALIKLDEAKNLVPNEESHDWQAIELWQAELRKRIR